MFLSQVLTQSKDSLSLILNIVEKLKLTIKKTNKMKTKIFRTGYNKT